MAEQRFESASSREVWHSAGLMPAPAEYDQPVPFVICDDFLTSDELTALLDYALTREPDFAPSGVLDRRQLTATVDPEYRRSSTLFDLGPLRAVFTTRIKSSLSRIVAELERDSTPTGEIETHLVASNEGEFFRRHTDNGADGVRTREITFAYYFHREPRAFSGGELRVYTSFVRAILMRSPARFETITPNQNRIVFFPSCMFHEVLPVRCTSRLFADSRFSVTGWIHRQEA